MHCMGREPTVVDNTARQTATQTLTKTVRKTVTQSIFCTVTRYHRRNNRRLVPELLGWGPTMYWSHNFFAVAFKKQDISQQVVTRMQDVTSEFSKIFRGKTPDPHSGRGRPHPASNTQPSLWPGAGKRPGVRTQTLVSLNFSALVAPLLVHEPTVLSIC